MNLNFLKGKQEQNVLCTSTCQLLCFGKVSSIYWNTGTAAFKACCGKNGKVDKSKIILKIIKAAASSC